MLSPAHVGRLRRSGVWDVLRRVHVRAMPPVCRFVHEMLVHAPLLTTELALKHQYDYSPILVCPDLVQHALPVGWGRKRGAPGAAGRPKGPSILRWYTHGGGWKSASRHLSRNLHGRFVLDGDWDRKAGPFAVRPTITQIFVDGCRPQDTDEYQKMRRWVDEGDLRWARGCRTADDVDRYFAAMATTFQNIRTHGYRTQRELGLDGGDEIRVCIDRDGRLCVFGGGTHRLSMAKLLCLEQVPVLVKRVHAQWARACREEFGGSTTEAVAAGLRALQESQPVGDPAERSTPAPRRGSAAC